MTAASNEIECYICILIFRLQISLENTFGTIMRRQHNSMCFGKGCTWLNLFDVMCHGIVREHFTESGCLRVGYIEQLSNYIFM